MITEEIIDILNKENLSLICAHKANRDYIASSLPRLKIEDDTAIYVIRDCYEDTSYVTAYDEKYLRIPKSEIEKLIQNALHSENKEAEIKIEGTYWDYKERWDDYCGTHEKTDQVWSASIQLSLKLTEEKPCFHVKYELEHIIRENDS